jgi:hypothetical protein
MAWIPTVAGAGLTALGAYGASKKQASSATNAANIRARTAANNAKLLAQSEDTKLKYLQGESALTRQQAGHAQQENYGMWDVSEQNIYNRNNAAALNAYNLATTRGLNEVDRFNVGQGNVFDQWTTGRADRNLQLSQKDQRMSELGVLLGMRPRGGLTFGDDPTLRQATHRPGEQPVTPDRVTRPYNPFVPTGSSDV